MECINKIVNILNKMRLLLLPGLLIISGCNDPLPPQTEVRITSRPVATVYKVKATDADAVPCYRIKSTGMDPITQLQSGQLVNIVSVEEGLIRFNDKLWLQIYPRLSHRPSCYVNVDNLIPYS